MVKIRGWAMALLVLLITACTAMPGGPSPQVKQALTPTGTLRIGLYQGAPTSVVKDPATGQMKGVGYDLGKALAERMGVPFETVIYPTIGELVSNAGTGQWDVSFLSITSERAKIVDFTSPHLDLELDYLARPDSPIMTIAEVDRPGVKVAVAAKGSTDTILSRTLKNAELIRVQGQSGGLEALKSGKADVYSAIKPNLFELSNDLPGSRVLDGNFGIDQSAMAIPKGRETALGYANDFIAYARSNGLIQKAIKRAGLRGAVGAAP